MKKMTGPLLKLPGRRKDQREEKDDKDAAPAPAPPGADKIKALEAMTSGNMADFMKRRMPEGCKCIFFGGITVDQRYVGLGVDLLLVSWGMEQADRHGAFLWVHSSKAGWPFFQKHGYEEVERFSFDLDEFAVAPPPRDGVFGDREKWETYTFRYGMRQPMKKK